VAGCFISAQYEKFLWLSVFLTIVLGALVTHRARLDAVAEDTPGAEPDLVEVPEPAS
jgi:hypothetical protein